MNNASVQFSDQGDYKTLEMQTLSGNGTFFMNTSLEQDAQGNSAGDLIHVTGNASGQFGLNISTSGTAAETINDGIRVAQIDDASRHNGLFSLENSVSIGAYDYYLSKAAKRRPAIIMTGTCARKFQRLTSRFPMSRFLMFQRQILRLRIFLCLLRIRLKHTVAKFPAISRHLI